VCRGSSVVGVVGRFQVCRANMCSVAGCRGCMGVRMWGFKIL